MKASNLAVAFSLLATPVAAQECATLSRPIIFTIDTGDTLKLQEFVFVPQHTVCIGFEPISGNIKSVQPTIDHPGCINIKGDPSQSVAPSITFNNDSMAPLQELDFDTAKQIFDNAVAACDKSPAGLKIKFEILGFGD